MGGFHMLAEIKIKANLHLGHVIKITFNEKTHEVRYTQSKKLLWEVDYLRFESLPYHFSIEKPFDFPSNNDLSKVLFEKGILYGCVLNYSKDAGYVYVTFHGDPNILYNIAKVTIEARKDDLGVVKEVWEKEWYNDKLLSFVPWQYQKCYCGMILDPDINKRCQNCTGYICDCGKCHCTEGKNFKL